MVQADAKIKSVNLTESSEAMLVASLLFRTGAVREFPRCRLI